MLESWVKDHGRESVDSWMECMSEMTIFKTVTFKLDCVLKFVMHVHSTVDYFTNLHLSVDS